MQEINENASNFESFDCSIFQNSLRKQSDHTSGNQNDYRIQDFTPVRYQE